MSPKVRVYIAISLDGFIAGPQDDLTITLAPIALGEGRPLFAGLSRRYPLEIVRHVRHQGAMVKIQARPKRPNAQVR